MTAPLLRPLATLGLALVGLLPLGCAVTPAPDRSDAWMEAILVFDG